VNSATMTKNRSKTKRAKIPRNTQLKLWIKAGGRCEFNGCNEYLLRDRLTLSETNYSDIAHIVAVSPEGPRGNDPLPADQRNKLENLMLVCKKHHKLIDDKRLVADYPKEKLLKFKDEHERRILRLTGIKPDNKTTIVRLTSKIWRDSVRISPGQIFKAVEPRYPTDDKGIEIDLTNLPGTDSPNYWKCGAECIQQVIADSLQQGFNEAPIEHLSIFALGPIPFLVCLGAHFGNKIPTDVYQRHRDSDSWIWKKRGRITKYKLISPTELKDSSKVALLLSLSGKIPSKDLPRHILQKYDIYEITLDGQDPNPMYLQRKKDLVGFKQVYHSFLRILRTLNPIPKEILLFPAVPVSVAVVCGSERLPKVDPPLVIYDLNAAKGNFYKTLTVR